MSAVRSDSTDCPTFARNDACRPVRRRCSAAVLPWRSLAQLAMDADRFCLLGMKPNFGSEVILDVLD